MKGKINKGGQLYIERAGIMRIQDCIFGGNYCEDGCPAFREPEIKDAETIKLRLCQQVGTLEFDEFTDERERGEE